MKQTKKKPQKLEKRPIKVQLSKDDLKELLTVLKNFMYEKILVELNRQNKRVFLNCSELDKRVSNLEIVENNHRAEIHKLKQRCVHDTQFDSISCFTSHNDGRTNFLTLIYKCTQCGLKFEKHSWHLSRKEKKAIRILGIKI